MFTKRFRVIILIIISVLIPGLSACSKVDKLQSQIDNINNTLNEAQKNVTDVGAISELGWLSKILRDSATGTPDEQKKARQSVARLFGVNEAELSQQQFFEVTLQVRDFHLHQNQQLYVDTKYLAEISPKAVSAIFDEAPGNVWNRYSLRDPDEFLRTPDEIRKLVLKRVSEWIPKWGGFPCRRDMYGKLTCSVTFAPNYIFTYAPGFDDKEMKKQFESKRQDFIVKLTNSILAPTEIAGLPPAGSRNGQKIDAWGLTSGATPYYVVFVPQLQVKEHPDMKLYAWLHLKGHPEKILGIGHEIEAVDFSDRCLSKVKYQNPTPPVNSKSNDGALCWYAFDLFGNGPRSQLTLLAKEAKMQNDSK